MHMRREIQNRPRLLVWVYSGTYWLLSPFRRWLTQGSWVEQLFIPTEKVVKGAIFDCRMCGQCVLHSTGMTCPMTCPKNLRNGPCGGVRSNGHCEIVPEIRCVWVQAWERSKKMPRYGEEILDILPPLNGQLQGSSAWINDFTGASQEAMENWTE